MNDEKNNWKQLKKAVSRKFLAVMSAVLCLSLNLNAQNELNSNQVLTEKQQCIVQIAAFAAQGGLQSLAPALNRGLDAGLTVNEIKEVLVHLYAYCGFPRSIRGLQTFMEVLDERKAKGISDQTGADASPVKDEPAKYERGKHVLSELTRTKQERPLSGYGAFAPAIDTFLKEHLFADIFERDVLTYAGRELVTISVLSAIGGVEPMLRSHLSICLNVGITLSQLNHFARIMQSVVGEKEAKEARDVINEVVNPMSEPVFPKGDKITNNNFTGAAWLQMLVINDSTYNTSVGNVSFEPTARTNWHKHPGGQILLVTEGTGYYQEKGKPGQLIQKGDVVRIPPGAVHWHGAAPAGSLTHIAISPNTDKGNVVWLQAVTDEEYQRTTN